MPKDYCPNCGLALPDPPTPCAECEVVCLTPAPASPQAAPASATLIPASAAATLALVLAVAALAVGWQTPHETADAPTPDAVAPESPAPAPAPEPSAEERRLRLEATATSVGPPSEAVRKSLATAFDGDPDAGVRAAAGKLLCPLAVTDPAGVALARRLLACDALDAADKASALDALADAPAGVDPGAAWPEVWALVAGSAPAPVMLKALTLLDGLMASRPDRSAAGDRRVAEALADLAFGAAGPAQPRYGGKCHAAAAALLRRVPDAAAAVLAERAATTEGVAAAGRLYGVLAELAADGVHRGLVVEVLDGVALPRARANPGLRAAAGAAAARVGGDRLAAKLLAWTEGPTGKDPAAPLSRVWAVETLGTFDPAALSADTRDRVARQLDLLERRGGSAGMKAAAGVAAAAYRRPATN